MKDFIPVSQLFYMTQFLKDVSWILRITYLVDYYLSQLQNKIFFNN